MALRFWLVFLILLISLFSFARENYTIGFSQCESPHDWRDNMEAEMLRELMFHDDLKLITKHAGESSSRQVKQIRELLNQNIDLLIVSPHKRTSSLKLLLEEIYQSGIPVIFIDRKIDTDLYTAFVGGDNYNIGYVAGIYVAEQLKQQGQVIEILVSLNTSPGIDRLSGFSNALQKFPHVRSVDRIYTDLNNQINKDSLTLTLEKFPDVKVIFAQTDKYAQAAQRIIKERFPDRKIMIIGVDGLPNEGGGIQMVEDEIIDATLMYPTGGKEAIQIASKILHREPFHKNNLLPTILIDKTNVKTTRLQYNHILTLQKDIDRSKSKLELLGGRYRTQKNLLFISLFLLIMIIFLSALLFRALRYKNIANLNLEKQKAAISKQNIELKKVSDQLEVATKAKLKFFTNISHEFRTPLTLLLGPVYDMEKDSKLDEKNKWRLSLIHKNAKRLLRLINQLMDFRKIEMDKMKILVSKYDMVAFLQSLKNDFNKLASDKGINLEFRTETQNMMVWFEKDHMDKVFFNLLSNALKFTEKEGDISIKLSQAKNNFEDKEYDCAKIVVEDNGKGISKEHLDRIFDRFYQIDQSENYVEGTGIGLSLTKGLIDIHKGAIDVWSEKGKGTRFSIYLRLGNEHFVPDEIIQLQTEKGLVNELIETELYPANNTYPEKKVANENISKPVILIVEDNTELRNYIKQSLIQDYIIVEAGNGKEGLVLIEENELDLIITDVMMPEMNGLELTRIIKSNVETCHILVIMLTAKSSEEQVIEGIDQGADDYIAKPFSVNYLFAKIHQLIENKNNIRRYFKELGASMPIKGLSKLDRSFIQNIDDLIAKNMNNEQFGVEFLGEKVGMSRVQLYRKIKQMTELSPIDYIKSIRLKKAIKLMSEEERTISEAAYQTGFSTPSYFSKCFKDLYNQTPREYLTEINHK